MSRRVLFTYRPQCVKVTERVEGIELCDVWEMLKL